MRVVVVPAAHLPHPPPKIQDFEGPPITPFSEIRTTCYSPAFFYSYFPIAIPIRNDGNLWATRFPSYRWNMEISPFIWSTFAFFISNKEGICMRMWKINSKRYNFWVPTISYAAHTQGLLYFFWQCNLANIMLANKNWSWQANFALHF